MFNLRDDLTDEIRINQKYAHLYLSEYPKTVKGKSIPKINEKSLLTSDYLKRVTTGFGGINPVVFPPNCRYLDVTNQGALVIIEEPPAFRTIIIKMSFDGEVNRLDAAGKLKEYGYDRNFATDRYPKKFTLAFPYVIFIFYINEYNELVTGQSYLRVARLTGLSDYLLRMPMLNISDSQYICFGGGASGKRETLNAAVENAINTFWGAEFNTDHTSNYRAYRDIAGVHSYMEWQALSQSNPMFIYNVDWIRMHVNLGQAIDDMKKYYRLTNKNEIGYHNLSDVFRKPADTGKEGKPTRRSRQKFKLFYDVAEGTFLDDTFCIHVGDSFHIKNGKSLCHINSLISFMDSGEVKYIRVERDDGRLIIYKNTKKFANYLLQEAKKVRFEEKGILKNGVEIKENDILIMKTASGKEMYRKVSYIRKAQEGFHEARFGDGFYILENTEAELFSMSAPKCNGILLEKDQQYVYITNAHSVPMHPGSIVKYEQVDVNSVGQLTVSMKHIDSKIRNRPFQLKLDSSTQNRNLFHIDEVKSLPPFFRIGRKMLVLRGSNSKLSSRYKVFGSPYGVIYEGHGAIDRPNALEIKKYMLGDDKFRVQSFDMDIEFAIGEKVVVSDWVKPFNMLTVKIINGFKFDESTGDITFILADKEGKLHQEQYVDGQHGIIYVGRIRKIVNKFGKLEAGTKIKAKEANIPHFPMKDTNIIIGFITDTGGPDPLVLCSNCCTLWYNDVMEKFQKTTMKAKKWAQLKHAPIDIAKIKFQSGDIIRGKSTSSYSNRMGWLVFKAGGSNSLRMLDFKYYSSHLDSYLLDRYVVSNSRLDCIANPRVGPKAQTEMGSAAAWSNLHGYSFTCERSPFKFINDERSMIHVQSDSK